MAKKPAVYLFLALFSLLVLTSSNAQSRSGILSFPCDIYGKEKACGTLKAGSVVTVKDGQGNVLGQTITTRDGRYGFLTCKADNPDTLEDEGALPGENIYFYVNGIKRDTQAVFKPGEVLRVDLLGTSAQGPPCEPFLPDYDGGGYDDPVIWPPGQKLFLPNNGPGGLRLISLPLVPQDSSVKSIYADGRDGGHKDVWEFTPSASLDPWKHYYPPSSYTYHNDLINMSPGKAYWVKTTWAKWFQFFGEPYNQNITFNLKKGWNPVGWPYLNSQLITESFPTLKQGTDYTEILRFNSSTQAFEQFSNNPQTDDFDSFGPAQGYYIYMLKDKTVTVKNQNSQPREPSFVINQGSAYTDSSSVILNFSIANNLDIHGAGGSDKGIKRLILSNDNKNWQESGSDFYFDFYVVQRPWVLSQDDGEKTVYAKFLDEKGSVIAQAQDSIILEAQPPQITIVSPVDGEVLHTPEVEFKGTIDGVEFSEQKTLSIGKNTLTKTATDASGESSVSIAVYYQPKDVIGPKGGEVFSKDGRVKITIPEGALLDDTAIELLTLNNEDFQGLVSEEEDVILTIVECKPYGTVFAKPVTLTYILDKLEVPGTRVKLGLYKNNNISIEAESEVDSDGRIVSFSLVHFSTYAAIKNLISSNGAPIGSGVQIPLPDMFTGSFSHAIPISVPPARAGMQPNVGLTYRSSNPNSWLGVGFNLNPGHIIRSTRLGPPSYNDTEDTFYFISDSGTTELIHLKDNLYQAKIESSFTKFFKESSDSWKVVSKDGSVVYFGQASNSKETSPKGTFSWYITKAIDTNSNYIEYQYTKDQGKSYLSRIDYTGNEKEGIRPTNTVNFFLEDREDISSSYITANRIATAKRLKEIEVKANSKLVWKYKLEYALSPDTSRSLLKRIRQLAYDNKELPVQSFEYQKSEQ